MKKLELLVVMFALLLTMGSCGGGQKGQGNKAYVADEVSPVDDNPYRDSTLYGLCANGSAMNTLQLITDLGDTVTLSIAKAKEEGKVFGAYAVGDRMAVLVNKDTTMATLVVNESALLGNWVMPNPLDGSDEVGIRLKEGGIAESIAQSSIEYKTWRMFNGFLEISLERDDGTEMAEEHLCQIIRLTADSLVYKDVSDENDLYEYSRQVIRNEKEIIKLEESSFEDYLW